MSKLFILFLLMASSFAYSQDKDYSYTYIELSVTESEDVGYIGFLSIKLPAIPIYFKGAMKEEEVESEKTIYKKIGQTITVGVHSSIADILNSVSKNGLSFNFGQFMDIYAEIGANEWELENPSKLTETGTDAYAKAGLRIGDADGWEYDLFFEKTRLAEVKFNPITGVGEYQFAEETNDNLGIAVIKHFKNKIGFSLGFNNDDFSGPAISLGLRYSL